jgi:glycosyltransferase involved in cell wall biosynthesis
MRILIAAPSSSSELSGVQRHAFNLARCLLTHPGIAKVDLVVAPWQQELAHRCGPQPDPRLQIHIAEMLPDTFGRSLWYYRRLPFLAREFRADLVHLAYPAPIDGFAFDCPIVVTLHDLYPYDVPSNFGFPKVLFNRMILRQCLRHADAIACVSDFTLERLMACVPAAVAQKALRIYNCVEPETSCALASPIENWQAEPFLLSVAQHRRNKNIPLLLRVFQRLVGCAEIHRNTLLVIVGIRGPETSCIRRAISQAGLSRNVILLEGLSEPNLQWCYRNCSAMLAPSTIEGFGLPIAEALLAGCPVVCSDIPAFREVGGDHCRYVSLDGLADVSFAEATLAALRETRPAPVPLPRFSAQSLAVEYARLYARLLSPGELAYVAHAPFFTDPAQPEGQSQ